MKIAIAIASILILAAFLRAWWKMDSESEDAPSATIYEPDDPEDVSPEKADAAAEIDRKYILRDHNAELLDAIEDELERASGKRKTALLRQRVTVEQKIFSLDRQIDKLYKTIYGDD